MRKIIYVSALLLCCFSVFAATAEDEAAAETAAETEAGTETPPTESAAQPIMLREQAYVPGQFSLPLGEQSIDVIFLEETLGEHHGNVLILPEPGDDIDSLDVVHALRVRLPQAGWSTMTISLHYPEKTSVFLSAKTETEKQEVTEPDQNNAEQADETAPPQQEKADTDQTEQVTESESEPKAEPDAQKEEQKEEQKPVSNAARLAGAIAYLQEKSPGTLVIIGLGDSASLITPGLESMASEFGIVLINAGAKKFTIPDNIPLLDIAPTRDDTLQQAAVERRASIRRAQPEALYSQRIIVGADKRFIGFIPTLTASVRAWLDKQFVRKEQP